MMQYIPSPPYGAYSGMPTIGTYYGYGYNNLNPMLLREQQLAEEKRRKEEERNNLNIWKMCITSSNTFYGYDTDQEELEDYLDMSKYNDMCQKLLYFDNMFYNIIQYDNQYRMQEDYNRQQYLLAVEESNKQPQCEDTLLEFLRGSARERYIETLESKSYEQQRDVRDLYDSNAYSRLLGVHNQSYQSLSPNINIDDMEIKLPSELRNERDIRRQQFINAVIQNDKRWSNGEG